MEQLRSFRLLALSTKIRRRQKCFFRVKRTSLLCQIVNYLTEKFYKIERIVAAKCGLLQKFSDIVVAFVALWSAL